jgi:hypothetical protein
MEPAWCGCEGHSLSRSAWANSDARAEIHDPSAILVQILRMTGRRNKRELE